MTGGGDHAGIAWHVEEVIAGERLGSVYRGRPQASVAGEVGDEL